MINFANKNKKKSHYSLISENSKFVEYMGYIYKSIEIFSAHPSEK